MDKIVLPVRVGHVGNGRIAIQNGKLVDAGWGLVECDSVDHARSIMDTYPSAAMPCWKNPFAAWNKGEASFAK